MDSDDGDVGAGVAVTFLGGDGFGIVEVGLKRAFVARFDVGDAIADGDDFEAEFMPRGAGKLEEGEFAEKCGGVGAADAHAMGADEGLAGAGGCVTGEIDDLGGFLGGECDGVHV